MGQGESAGLHGWLAGRLPEGWFEAEPTISVDRDEIVVAGRVPAPELSSDDDELTRSAAEAGRITRFREETRDERMAIDREAQHLFGRSIAWGAEVGGTSKMFTNLSVPVMTRLRQPERLVLDTLVESGVARSRSDALAWCVKLVGTQRRGVVARSAGRDGGSRDGEAARPGGIVTGPPILPVRPGAGTCPGISSLVTGEAPDPSASRSSGTMRVTTGSARRSAAAAAALIVAAISLDRGDLRPGRRRRHHRQAPGPDSWTVYHGDPEGTGVAASVAAVDTATRAWTSPVLDGQLLGEPLVTSRTDLRGHGERHRLLPVRRHRARSSGRPTSANPVPASSLPCGDIRPTVGITGTPVIDTSRSEIFAVADELVGGEPAHVLVGLSTKTGKLELSEHVDPAGASPRPCCSAPV